MAHDTLTVPSGSTPETAVQVTTGNVTDLRVQNLGHGDVYLQARNGTGAVTSSGAIRLQPDEGISNIELAVMFAGVSGANRVYAWSQNGTQVSFSHA